MVKEEFEQRVLEQQIFDELKDITNLSPDYVRKKYQGLNIDYSRLYRKIVNYQVNTYGASLYDRTIVTKEDYVKRAINIKNLRWQRRNNGKR